VDVPALVQSVLAEAESLNRGQHRIASKVEPLWLLANREEIRSAFSNLVTNAIRYTPAGGDILVSWGNEDEPRRFACATTARASRRSTFRAHRRFYRVDRSRSRSSGGTGLGSPS